MRRLDPIVRRLPVLGLLLLAGCERDPAELIQEINAAREGCTEEKLKAGAEECVQMMERYAEMGTEAMETYIGAVKSLDQALRRMPPPQFDTAGLGRALSLPGGEAPAWGDTSPAARGLYPSAPGFSRQGEGWEAPAPPADPWYRGAPEYPEDGRYGRDRAYPGDPRYGREPLYDDEEGWYEEEARYPNGGGYRDPYSGRGSYDPRHPEGIRRGAGPLPGERYADPRSGGWRDGAADGRRAPPRAVPQRGRLLPPEERLRRPWLEEERRREPAPRRYPRAEWPDTAIRR